MLKTSSFSFNSLVIASHNLGKIREFNILLSSYNITAISSLDLGISDAIENGNSFASNASIKSMHVARFTDLPILADDSGLSIEGLLGAPGIYSSRYAGADKDFNKAMLKLLSSLEAKNLFSASARKAKFTCALSFIAGKDKDGLKNSKIESSKIEQKVESKIESKIFIGELKGHIANKISGTRGFGYDPIFIADGQKQTLSELHSYEKQALSHRSKAFAKFIKYLQENHALQPKKI